MSEAESQRHKLIFEKDVPVPMSDGTVLRANVFRPDAEGPFPVVMAKGAYGEDVHFRDRCGTPIILVAAAYPAI